MTEVRTNVSPAEQQALRDQVISTFETRIANLKAILADRCIGHIHAWPHYSLGVILDGGKFRVVGVEDATVLRSRERVGTYHNGGNEAATFMPRRKALEEALAMQEKSLEDIRGIFARAA